jgi:hypothetical protein
MGGPWSGGRREHNVTAGRLVLRGKAFARKNPKTPSERIFRKLR